MQLGLSEEKAAEAFTKVVLSIFCINPDTFQLIETSLGSLSTKMNFFIHNVAQLSSGGPSDGLYPFCPTRFTKDTDGVVRIVLIDYKLAHSLHSRSPVSESLILRSATTLSKRSSTPM